MYIKNKQSFILLFYCLTFYLNKFMIKTSYKRVKHIFYIADKYMDKTHELQNNKVWHCERSWNGVMTYRLDLSHYHLNVYHAFLRKKRWEFEPHQELILFLGSALFAHYHRIGNLCKVAIKSN